MNAPEHQHSHPASAAEPSDCVEFLDQIVYFIDNELDEADVAAVRQHLDTCNPCLEKYDLQRTVKQIVARSCSEPAPEDVRERVLLRIREVQVRIRES